MFHVVLIEPEIPPNTGNIGRLCLATGAQLHLVKPLGFSLDDRALRLRVSPCGHRSDRRCLSRRLPDLWPSRNCLLFSDRVVRRTAPGRAVRAEHRPPHTRETAQRREAELGKRSVGAAGDAPRRHRHRRSQAEANAQHDRCQPVPAHQMHGDEAISAHRSDHMVNTHSPSGWLTLGSEPPSCARASNTSKRIRIEGAYSSLTDTTVIIAKMFSEQC